MKAHLWIRRERSVRTTADEQAVGAGRTRRTTIAAAIVVAIVLGFAEREMYGARDGSFHALLAPLLPPCLAAISGARLP